MRGFTGTVAFLIAASSTFRIVYGQWPPTSGNFGQWFFSDSRARWATLAAVLVGLVVSAIVRGLTGTPGPLDDKMVEASNCLQLGLTYHQERRVNDAAQMFQRAITLYEECGRGLDAAPAYASLGKLYFDIGELERAEQQLIDARARFQQLSDGRDAVARIDSLLELIAERRLASDSDERYVDPLFHFSLTIPAGWVRQKLVGEFVGTGGRLAISHVSHAATFNVSVGPPDRPEWLATEARSRAAAEYVKKISSRVGPVSVIDSIPISGEANVVVVEYGTQTTVGGDVRRRNNGLISIVHKGIEYTLQWSAEQRYESQARSSDLLH